MPYWKNTVNYWPKWHNSKQVKWTKNYYSFIEKLNYVKTKNYNFFHFIFFSDGV